MACSIVLVDGREVMRFHRRPLSLSRRAVEARVRQALRQDGQLLRKPRGAQERQGFGDYFTVDAHTGNPERWRCDLEELAKEYHVLGADKSIAD
jgi:hypothetical protein